MTTPTDADQGRANTDADQGRANQAHDANRAVSFVFVHGWGLDAGFWRPVMDRLTEPGRDCIAIDLGFRGRPTAPTTAPIGVPAGRVVVAVGHSTGLVWLLQTRPFPWDALVAVNGFTRFTAAPGFPAVDPRLLRRMLARLGADVAGVTAEFLKRCAGSVDPVASLGDGDPDPAALHQGLVWLRDWDCRSAFAADRAPALALAGRADPIVPPAMTEACFSAAGCGRDDVALRWHDGGGHLLPIADPDWCADSLRAFAQRLVREPIGHGGPGMGCPSA